MAEAFAEGNLGGEAKVSLQGGGVCVGCGDVSRLHGDQLFMDLKVVVLGQNAGSQEFFLEDVHKIQQVLRLTATNVVDLVGRDGQAIFAFFAFGSFVHNTYDSLNDIIYVCKVSTAVAVIIDLDGLSFEQLIGEAEVGHIRAPGRAIDREESEARCGNVVKLAVAMGKEFVAFLGGSVQTYRIIYTVIGTEGDLLVTAIDAG